MIIYSNQIASDAFEFICNGNVIMRGRTSRIVKSGDCSLLHINRSDKYILDWKFGEKVKESFDNTTKFDSTIITPDGQQIGKIYSFQKQIQVLPICIHIDFL